MAVMVREAWTDERIDDLAAKIDKGFADAKVEIRDLRIYVDRGLGRVDADIRELRTEVNGMKAEMNSRFDSMQRTMIIGFVTLFASIVASVIGGVLAALTLA